MRTSTPLRLLAALLLAAPFAAAQGPGADPGLIPIDHLPFTISQSGSYFLTTTLASSTSGISVTASNVTINLNSFALVGGASSTSSGIVVPVSVSGLRVFNGEIRSWKQNGILAANASEIEVHGVHCRKNGEWGIRVGSNAIVEDCRATANVLGGITTQSRATIRRCEANDNDGTGISTGAQATVTDCIVTSNGGDGIFGASEMLVERCNVFGQIGGANIRVQSRSVVADNRSAFGKVGILVEGGRTAVRQNDVVSCTSAGIRVTVFSTCAVVRNTLGENSVHLDVPAGNLVGPLLTADEVEKDCNPHSNYVL